MKFYFHLIHEICRKKSFPALSPEYALNEKIAIITVNYNTLGNISLLLFSIFKNIGKDRISDIIVVDNHSTDGSRTFLKALHDHGYIELIANDQQRYHGLGLNQAVNHLAVKVRRKLTAFRYIWILDSDTIILRSETIEKAYSLMRETDSCVMGQFQDNGYPHISSVWIDPYKVWNFRVSPFTSDGWPSLRFYRSILRSSGKIHPFLFMKDNYILHLGESTLKQIFLQNESSNDLYQWASKYHSHHYHGNRNGKKILDSVIALYHLQMEESGEGDFIKMLSSSMDCQADFERIVNEFSEE